MDRLKLGIIFGGCSEEHPISVKSAQEVARNLDVEKYEPYYIGITKTGAWKLCHYPDADWENGSCRPAVLSPDRSVHDLLQALREATTDAADDGIALYVNSGWRSPEYQNQLLHEAVSKYGSEEKAARWVATAETSAHVSGDAVDIGSFDATTWLSEHGARYGVCQIYRNKPWHYELRRQAIDRGCPPMYADPTHDPRMHR